MEVMFWLRPIRTIFRTAQNQPIITSDGPR